jgi:hypothetical protein
MLSISSWLAMRPREAPSASRVANSRPRAAPRARSRLATFEHASRTSSEVPAIRIHSGVAIVRRRFDRPCEAGVRSR